jgi:ribonuclease HI
MRQVWDLPKDELLFEHNQDWFMHALRCVDVDQRVAFLMTLWRVWHVHNEITHQKKPAPVEASRRFLMSYVEQNQVVDTDKGKQSVDYGRGFGKKKQATEERPHIKQKWKPPDAGLAKLNVDGAFSTDGRAGVGMILRRSDGSVIVAACRSLPSCADALEEEIVAIDEGLNLAMVWEPGAIAVETDSAVALKLISESTPNLSRYAMRVSSIREKLKERVIGLCKVSREANGASHSLASLGRVHERTSVWLQNYPPDVALAIQADCIPPV